MNTTKSRNVTIPAIILQIVIALYALEILTEPGLIFKGSQYIFTLILGIATLGLVLGAIMTTIARRNMKLAGSYKPVINHRKRLMALVYLGLDAAFIFCILNSPMKSELQYFIWMISIRQLATGAFLYNTAKIMRT